MQYRPRIRRRPAFAGLALLATFLAALSAAPPARAEIGSYLVYDLGTGAVLAQKNALKPWYPASLTKLMTTYVAFHAMREGRIAESSPVRISPQAHAQPPSRVGFDVGTVIRMDVALRILMTKSANDVAVAVAEAIGGTERNFIREMNERAAALGMTQTHFTNPHGLPSHDQTTSARDMGLLVRALKEEFPDKADYFTMSGVRIAGRYYRNHNKLVSHFPGTTGMKTGFICSSGFNLAASAKRGDRELVAIVLGGYTGRERNERTAEYLELAFRRLQAGDVDTGVTLDDLAPGPDTPVEAVDLRPIVCGPTRPETPYDDGVINIADVESGEVAVAYAAEDGGDESEAAEAALEATARATGERTPREPLDKPISYLRKRDDAPAPVDLSIGGADETRPNPLSGTIVGGGPPPMPRGKPKALIVVKNGVADPAKAYAVAEAVRLAVAPTGAGGAGSMPPHLRFVEGVPLPARKPREPAR